MSKVAAPVPVDLFEAGKAYASLFAARLALIDAEQYLKRQGKSAESNELAAISARLGQIQHSLR